MNRRVSRHDQITRTVRAVVACPVHHPVAVGLGALLGAAVAAGAWLLVRRLSG